MSVPPKRPRDEKRPTKKVAKRATVRDVPRAPTARDIEESLRRGTSVPLRQFVETIKL